MDGDQRLADFVRTLTTLQTGPNRVAPPPPGCSDMLRFMSALSIRRARIIDLAIDSLAIDSLDGLGRHRKV